MLLLKVSTVAVPSIAEPGAQAPVAKAGWASPAVPTATATATPIASHGLTRRPAAGRKDRILNGVDTVAAPGR